MSFAAVAIGGAGLIGGVMSARSADSASRRQANATRSAADQQRNFDTNNALDVMVRQMRAMYGQQQGDAMLRQYLPQDQIDQLFGSNPGQYGPMNDRITAIDSRLAQITEALRTGRDMPASERRAINAERNRLNGERRTLNTQLSQQTQGAWQPGPQGGNGAAGFPGGGGAGGQQGGGTGPTANGGGGYMGQMNDLIGQFDAESRGILTDYNTDTQRIGDLGEQNIADLYGWGDRRDGQITRDLGRAQRSSNAAIGSQMKRSGLSGSSLAMQAMSGNARRLQEGANDQRATIQDQLRALMSGARNDNINRLMTRSGGRTTLQGNIVNGSQQLRQQPLQAQMNMMTGSAFAPFANRSSAGYFPGVTGNNNATTGLGAALGGQFAGMGMQGLLNQLYQPNSNAAPPPGASNPTGTGHGFGI